MKSNTITLLRKYHGLLIEEFGGSRHFIVCNRNVHLFLNPAVFIKYVSYPVELCSGVALSKHVGKKTRKPTVETTWTVTGECSTRQIFLLRS